MQRFPITGDLTAGVHVHSADLQWTESTSLFTSACWRLTEGISSPPHPTPTPIIPELTSYIMAVNKGGRGLLSKVTAVSILIYLFVDRWAFLGTICLRLL